MSDNSDSPPSEGERSEPAAPRRRAGGLEEAGRPRAADHHWFRSLGSVLLILFAALLALLSVVAVWANSIVRDTDRYVATVGPLAGDPDVQKAVTHRVTSVVLAQIDVKALVKEVSDAASQKGVPPRAAQLLKSLDKPIENGLKQLIGNTVERVVTSSAFKTVWVKGNRRAHSALDKALTGKANGAVSLKDNEVAIDVAPVVARVKDRLVGVGLAAAAKIPDVHTDFVVFASKDVGKVKNALRVLQIMGVWLPLVALLIAAAGVYVAFDRRHALIGAALAVFVAMLGLGIALTVARDVYLGHLPPGTSQAAAGTVYDALVTFLRAGVRELAAVALFTAVAAFLAGPSRIALLIRAGCRRTVAALRDAAVSAGLRLGAAGRFVHRFKRGIGAAILVVAAIVLFTWTYPTVMVVVWIAVLTLVGFAIREFLDADADAAPPSGSRPRVAAR
ncbi:hypothetical protein [Streptomyces sp. NPDC091212]|uniref:hypothetical protein n=1 Tax=Streptomyces sp. NPDC091212 TaxID=3155191 RepID=UPI00343934B2